MSRCSPSIAMAPSSSAKRTSSLPPSIPSCPPRAVCIVCCWRAWMAESVRETWGRYAPSFAAEGAAAEDRESIRRLVDLCDLEQGSLVLDVATGAGYTAFAFARAGMRVVPSDPTHEMLLATREGWQERSLPGTARCVETWAETLPFAD